MLGSIPVHFARMLAHRLELDVFMPPMDSPKMDVTMYWLRSFDRDSGSAWLRDQIADVLRPARGSEPDPGAAELPAEPIPPMDVP